MAIKLPFGVGAKLNAIIIFILTICFVIMGYITYSTVGQLTRKDTNTSLSRYTKDLSVSVDELFSKAQDILISNASSSDIINVFNSDQSRVFAQNLLENSYGSMKQANALLLTNLQGTVLMSNEDASAMRGINISSLPFFKEANASLRFISKDAFVSPFMQAPVMALSQQVSRPGESQPLGLIILFLDLKKISQSYFSDVYYTNDGYPVVVDKQGRYMLHPDLSLVMVQNQNQELINSINKGQTLDGHFFRYVDDFGIKKIISSAQMTAAPWYASVIMNYNGLNKTGRRILLIFFITSVISIIILSVSFNIIIKRWLLNRIISIKSAMDVASHGDLTIRNSFDEQDEISSINDSFSHLMGGLGALIVDMNQKMQDLTASSGELSNCIKNTIDAVNNIDSSIKYAKNEVTRQTSSIGETSEAVRNMSSSIEELDKTISHHTDGIEKSSQVMREMIGHISSIGKMIENANNYTIELKEESLEGEQKLNEALSQINNVAKSSKQLVKANALVAKVASKTTILAMNAAIEAAHAGNQGSGFAVVADEVRSLAELSTAQSRNIQRVIADISNLINVAVTSSQDTQVAITKIFQTVGNIEALMLNISRLMNEQTEHSQDVLDGLDELKSVASGVKTASNTLTKNSEHILRNADELTTTSRGMDQAFNQVFVQIQEINQVIEAIKYLDSKNRKGIGTLLLASARFKVSEKNIDHAAAHEHDSNTTASLQENAPAGEVNIEEDDDIVLF